MNMGAVCKYCLFDGYSHQGANSLGFVAGMLVAGLALAGCGSASVAGPPTPLTNGGLSNSSTEAPNGDSKLPPRPKELALDGVNPCTLFPEERRAEFGVNGRATGPNPNGEITSCGYSTGNGRINIVDDRQRGAVYFLGENALSHGSAVSVGDYPAVSGYVKADKDRECFTEIDVADGQNLSIQYSDNRRPGPDVLCPIAKRVALVALDALKAQKK